MADSCTHVYVHFVWTTWDRAPLVTAGVRRRVYACIAAKCVELKCELVEIGGTEDHVHVLARVHSMVSVAELAKGMKGASSHLVNHEVAPEGLFRWQGSYGAFSVGEREVEQVREYIRYQEQHHAHGSVQPAWEQSVETRPPTPTPLGPSPLLGPPPSLRRQRAF